jgi:hypothetical protein
MEHKLSLFGRVKDKAMLFFSALLVAGSTAAAFYFIGEFWMYLVVIVWVAAASIHLVCVEFRLD